MSVILSIPVISIRHEKDCLLLPVRVQPGASRQSIDGEHAGRLKVAVTPPPEEGRANKALIRFLAKVLGISRSDLTLMSGQTSRNKLIAIEEMSFETLAKVLDMVQLERTEG